MNTSVAGSARSCMKSVTVSALASRISSKSAKLANVQPGQLLCSRDRLTVEQLGLE